MVCSYRDSAGLLWGLDKKEKKKEYQLTAAKMNFPFPFARNAQIIFSFPLFLSVCVFCFHFHFVCFVCQFRLELVVVAVVLFCVIELFSCLSWIRLSSLLLFNLFFLCPTKTMKLNEKIPKKQKNICYVCDIWSGTLLSPL